MLTRLPILIFLEAEECVGYRAIFEDQGETTTSIWYRSEDELREAWEDRAEAGIETSDARISELRDILKGCESAYAANGSIGVTLFLHSRFARQAAAEATRAAINLDDVNIGAHQPSDGATS